MAQPNVVEIPGVGIIDFGSLSPAETSKQAKRLYDEANPVKPKPWSEQLGLNDDAPSLNRSPTRAWLTGLVKGTGEGLVDAAQGLASNANVLGTVYDTVKRAATGKPTEKPTVVVDRPGSFMGAYGAYAPLVAAAGYGLVTAPAAFTANAATGLAASGATKVTTEALLKRAGVSDERAGSIADLLAMGVAYPAGSRGSSYLPSSIKKKAGAAINAVEQAVGNAPVIPMSQQPLTAVQARVVSALDEIRKLEATGGTATKGVHQLDEIINAGGDINFTKGRRFYSDIANPSNQEKFERKKTMGYAVKELQSALHSAMTAASESVGKGEEYAAAMSKYAKASSIQTFLIKARPWLIGLGLASAGITPTVRKLLKTASGYVAGDAVP